MPQSGWTLDQVVANLTRSFPAWPVGPVGYTFMETANESDFVALTAAQREAVTEAFALFGDVANLTFAERPDDGDYEGEITFGNFTNQGPSTGGTTGMTGSVELGPGMIEASYGFDADNAFEILLHEIGHSLSLSHPGPYNAGDGTIIRYWQDATYVEDSRQYTVMSYFGEHETGAGYGHNFAATPLLHDVLALQFLYGANMETRRGNTIYGFNSNSGRDAFNFSLNTEPVVAIWDAGGRDTINISQYSMDCRLNLGDGQFSSIGGLTNNLSICFGAIIENAVAGKGDDIIIGNVVGNRIKAGGGDDIVYGLGGHDSLDGGAGDDLLDGSEGNDNLVGHSGNDTLFGGDGNDVLKFAIGELSSGDFVAGGAGIDTLLFYGGGDVSLTPSSTNVVGIECIQFIAGTNSLFLSNRIFSLSEANSITVIGGSGSDTINARHVSETYSVRLEGGDGDDTLYGSDGATIFRAGNGSDTLQGWYDEDKFEFEIDQLDASDSVDGIFGNDVLVFIDSGLIRPLQFHGVRNVREVHLATGQNSFVLSDSIILQGVEVVRGGRSTDILDASKLSGANSVFFIAGDGNDIFKSGDGDDRFIGEQGIDTVDYRHASARVRVDLSLSDAQQIGGGQGRDRLQSVEAVDGSRFSDFLKGDSGDNVLIGNAGNDMLAGGFGNDTASYRHAKAGVSVSLAAAGAQSVGEGQGADTLTSIEVLEGSVFNDRLTGNDLNNGLSGGTGNDVLRGGLGEDTVAGGAGNDSLAGGAGADTAAYTEASGGVRVNLSRTGSQSVGSGQGSDRLISIENLVGSSFADELTGSSSSNSLTGGAGNDLIAGGGGADSLDGGLGDDVLQGGEGHDDLRDGDGNNLLRGGNGNDQLGGGRGNDRLYGDAGDDDFTIFEAGGNDVIDGGLGVDYLGLYFLGRPISIDLSLSRAQDIGPLTATVRNVENVSGGESSDTLIGDEAANRLDGYGGDDRLSGLGGNDVLSGGEGSDFFSGGGGDDRFVLWLGGADVADGGSGSDYFQVLDETFTATDRLRGGSGYDTLYISGDYSQGLSLAVNTIIGIEGISFADGNSYRMIIDDGNIAAGATLAVYGAGLDPSDRLMFDATAERDGRIDVSGGAGDDVLTGGAGADYLTGSGGEDRLVGSGGNDDLRGDGGDDMLTGGYGRDTITGGAGADTFMFRGGEAGAVRARADAITDFDADAGDRINLRRIDARETVAGNQNFAFVGAAAFSGTAGELRYDIVDGNAFLQGDTDGDGAADFFIRLDGMSTVAASDLVL